MEGRGRGRDRVLESDLDGLIIVVTYECGEREKKRGGRKK